MDAFHAYIIAQHLAEALLRVDTLTGRDEEGCVEYYRRKANAEFAKLATEMGFLIDKIETEEKAA